jgi:hypothetical protein
MKSRLKGLVSIHGKQMQAIPQNQLCRIQEKSTRGLGIPQQR